MPNGKKKIKKIAETAFDAVTPLGSIVNPAIRKAVKDIGGRKACQNKGGKWVKGKCIPESQIRTGKKKHSDLPIRIDGLGRKRSIDPAGHRRES
jgi:hypothetical protein